MHCGCNLKGYVRPKLSIEENIKIAKYWGIDIIQEGNMFKFFYDGKIMDCSDEEGLDSAVYCVCSEIAFENTIKAFHGGENNGKG